MTIKAICFDLDGVYFTSKGKNSFHQALIDEYGVAQDTVDNLMYRSPEMAQLVRGQTTPEAFWTRVREITGITVPDEDLAARWIRDYEVDANVRQTVLKAKEHNYKTCVCTNNNAIRLPRLVRVFKLDGDFDTIVSSHEVGHTKPEREIFEELIKRLNVKPDELVYSDDNPDRLAGAQALGIKTFVYENFGQFTRQLRDFGIDLG